MSVVKFPYIEKHSRIFGKILRPIITLEVYSEVFQEWDIIDEVLADPGADISLLPRSLGEPLVKDITSGEYIEIKGVVPNSILIAFIHELTLKISEKEFKTKIALAESNVIPAILGRYKALDLFDVSFTGKKLSLNIESTLKSLFCHKSTKTLNPTKI
ncbi:MAG: hypothetical protein IIA88_02115 [Bacteroidetes bacterium]|nr:hypothetical protein [Bacteroidota bacterium]